MTRHTMDLKFFVFFVVILGFMGCNAKKIPSYVQVCKTSNPEYETCVRKSLEALKPRLVKGISKMRIPPLEPLRLPALEVNRNTDALKVKLKLKDIKAYGGTGFVVNSLKANPKDLTTQISITFPHLYLEADYDVDGRLLLIPLKGKGVFKGNFTNIKTEVGGKGKVMTTNKLKHVEIDSIKSKTRVLGGSDVKFINADPATDGITNTAAAFFNNNKETVYSIIYPILDETADEIILQIANSVMVNLPFDEILPN